MALDHDECWHRLCMGAVLSQKSLVEALVPVLLRAWSFDGGGYGPRQKSVVSWCLLGRILVLGVEARKVSGAFVDLLGLPV